MLGRGPDDIREGPLKFWAEKREHRKITKLIISCVFTRPAEYLAVLLRGIVVNLNSDAKTIAEN